MFNLESWLLSNGMAALDHSVSVWLSAKVVRSASKLFLEREKSALSTLSYRVLAVLLLLLASSRSLLEVDAVWCCTCRAVEGNRMFLLLEGAYCIMLLGILWLLLVCLGWRKLDGYNNNALCLWPAAASASASACGYLVILVVGLFHFVLIQMLTVLFLCGCRRENNTLVVPKMVTSEWHCC